MLVKDLEKRYINGLLPLVESNQVKVQVFEVLLSYLSMVYDQRWSLMKKIYSSIVLKSSFQVSVRYLRSF